MIRKRQRQPPKYEKKITYFLLVDLISGNLFPFITQSKALI